MVARMLDRGNRGVVLAAADAAKLSAGDRAADLGFGGGIGLAALLTAVQPDGRVVGIDLSEDMVRRARRRFASRVADGSLDLQTGSISELPVESASLDALITVNTIYFLADLDQAFGEMHRVLRPSGRAVIGIGDPDAMASMPFTPYGFTLRPVAEVSTSLARAGLEVSEVRRAGAGPAAAHVLVGRKA